MQGPCHTDPKIWMSSLAYSFGNRLIKSRWQPTRRVMAGRSPRFGAKLESPGKGTAAALLRKLPEAGQDIDERDAQPCYVPAHALQ